MGRIVSASRWLVMPNRRHVASRGNAMLSRYQNSVWSAAATTARAAARAGTSGVRRRRQLGRVRLSWLHGIGALPGAGDDRGSDRDEHPDEDDDEQTAHAVAAVRCRRDRRD